MLPDKLTAPSDPDVCLFSAFFFVCCLCSNLSSLCMSHFIIVHKLIILHFFSNQIRCVSLFLILHVVSSSDINKTLFKSIAFISSFGSYTRLLLILRYHLFCFHITIFIESGSLWCFIARLKLAHRRTERGRGGSTASAPVELEYVPGEQGSHADAPVKGERNRYLKNQFIANSWNLEKDQNAGWFRF